MTKLKDIKMSRDWVMPDDLSVFTTAMWCAGGLAAIYAVKQRMDELIAKGVIEEKASDSILKEFVAVTMQIPDRDELVKNKNNEN